MATWTLLAAHKRLTEYLEKHGVDAPRLSSEILIAHSLGIPRIQIYVAFERELSEEEVAAAGELARQLAKGKPLQLVVGNASFMGHTFRVAPGVFIPRPETEILADGCIRRLADRGAKTIVDVCCGTGVVGVSLLLANPEARCFSVDISPAAAELTLENARTLGVDDRMVAVVGDLLGPVTRPDVRFDAIVSNPPYIPAGDIAGLDANVRDYDPRVALDGGADGLDIVRRLAMESCALLRPEGFLALEIGIGQAGATAEIMASMGFTNVEIERDYSGIERVVTGFAPADF